MNPIIITGVRVLRPSECKDVIAVIPKRYHSTMFKALLYSGGRYVEMQRLQRHPEWFDGNFVLLPEMAMRKAKRKQKERWIRLNPLGREIVSNFLELDRKLPTWNTWDRNLTRWAIKAGLDPDNFSVKTTRKTWESWLVFYYPERLTEILLSQGHNIVTSIRHYLGLPFTEQDKQEMKEFVEGWI